MHKIFKFQVALTDIQEIPMPKDSRILTLQEQRGKFCIWAICDPDAPYVQRRFCIFGTGHPLPEQQPLTYIGTFQIERKELVLHLFEKCD